MAAHGATITAAMCGAGSTTAMYVCGNGQHLRVGLDACLDAILMKVRGGPLPHPPSPR